MTTRFGLLAVILLLVLFGVLFATRGPADGPSLSGMEDFALRAEIVTAQTAAYPWTRSGRQPFTSSLSPDYSVYDSDDALVFSLSAVEAASLSRPAITNEVGDCSYPEIWLGLREQRDFVIKPGRYTLVIHWRNRHIVSDGIHECVLGGAIRNGAGNVAPRVEQVSGQ